jgi:hypothetical protein
MVDPIPMPTARAARLMALSRDAQEQSIKAIRSSLHLLRHPIYPEERSSVQLGPPAAFSASKEERDGGSTQQGYRRDRGVGG